MRDAALMPLTHEHHHALAAARRLQVAAKGSDDERVVQTQTFIRFFTDDTLQHFRDEEESVFPLVAENVKAEETLQRVMIEHLRIHAAVASLRAELDGAGPSPETMTQVAKLLQDHIRFEEKVVFPMIEDMVDGAVLGALSLPPRDRESGQTT